MTQHRRDYWRGRARVHTPSATDDFLEELVDHVCAKRDDVLARGGSEDEADQAAEAELRAWQHVPPPSRPDRSHPFVGAGLDWRSAWRLLRWRPSFALSAVFLLTLAVGAASATTAVVYGILRRPMPYPDQARLVTVWERSVRNGTGQVSYPDAQDVIATGVFDSAALFSGGVGTLTGGASVDRVKAIFTDPTMLSMLGARPLKGRLYDATDAGRPNAVISHRLWQQQFAGRDDIVGHTFRLSGTPLTVIGVLPAGFDFEVPVARTFLLSDHDIWQPLEVTDFRDRRDVSTYQMLARLAPGTTLEAARTAVDATAARLSRDNPTTNRDRAFVVLPLRDIVTESAAPALRLAAGAAAVLVLAALANLAGLAVSRARARRSELTIRQALGANRGHLVRQILTEHVPLAAGATVAGLTSGALIASALAASRQVRLPRPDAVVFDLPAVLAGTLVAFCGWLVLAGPLLISTRRQQVAGGGTRVAGHTSRRGHRMLVAGEIALALLLCVTASAVSLTLWRLASTDAGFDPAGRVTMRLTAFASDAPERADVMRVFDDVRARVAQLPGVVGVAISSSLPLSGQFTGTGAMHRPGAPAGDRVTGGWQHVTPGYFDAAGIAMLRGRDFTETERTHSAHVSILSESMARRLFGDADPLGQRIQAGGGDDWHDVVGIVEDVRHRSLADPGDLRVYDLTGQHWNRTMFLVVHTERDPAGTIDDIRHAVRAVAPGAPLFEVATGDELRLRSVAVERLATLLSGVVAVTALLIAAFGVHAIVACAVSERRREMGVRLALGSSQWGVGRLILADAGGMAIVGALAGVIATLLALRSLAAVLPGLTPDVAWPVVTAVSGLVIAAGVAAALPAARRAASTDPVSVLQSPD